jgi:hypothetical protein
MHSVDRKGGFWRLNRVVHKSNHKVLKVKYIRHCITSAADKQSTKKLTYFYAAADRRGGGITVKFPFSLTNRDGNESNRIKFEVLTVETMNVTDLCETSWRAA